MKILVIILCICGVICGTKSNSEVGNIRRKSPGYIFSLPKTLVEGKNETICVSLHDAELPAKVIIDFKLKEKHFYTTEKLESEYSCFEIHVPTLKYLKESQYVSIRTQLYLNGAVYSSHNQDPILMHPSKPVTFIETDRPIYKPNDLVRFRILILNNDLLPYKEYQIPEVRIRNPLDISVDVWENVTTELGLSQLEFQLPKESITGKWKIEVNEEVRTFEVSKYVLPRFGVTIINPKIIYFENPWAAFKVCSNYSYGQPVKGSAFIKLTDSHNNMQPIVRLKEMENGCAFFIFKRTQLNFVNLKDKLSMYDPKIHILITATVTEHGTDRIEVATAKSLVYLKPYAMRFVTDNIFQPGFPYRGKLQFYYVSKDLTNEVVEICYNIAIRRSWNYLNNEQCRNFTVKDGNTINFQILPLKGNVIHLHLNARSLNNSNVGDSFLVVRLYSPSNSYIYLEDNYSEHIKCKGSQQFNVQYIAEYFNEGDNVTFYYMVKTRGQLLKLGQVHHVVRKHYLNYEYEFKNLIGIKHKFHKLNVGVDKFMLKFKLDEKVMSKYQLAVYYVAANGEVVSASKTVNIEPCLRNKVKASWSKEKLSPGQQATLNIKASSSSLCAVSAVDKSIKFLSHYQPLNANSLLKPFVVEKEAAPSNRKPCLPPTRKRSQASTLLMPEENWDHRRRKRYVYSFSEDFDAYDTFNKFGTITISNLKIITKSCYSGPSISKNNGVQFLTNYYESGGEEDISIPIRSIFPETWLWELVPVGAHETVTIQRKIPHTITTWITNVMCLSEDEGVGLSETTEIASYRPFFVDVLAPYSIKRGENLYLNVMIFNYLSYSIPIRISLGQSSGLKLIDVPISRTGTYCVRSNETVTHMLQMVATEIGITNVTILAELDSVYPGLCGPDIVVNKRDVVFKTIIVEPEGYPTTVAKSALLCSSPLDFSSSNNVSWDLNVPSEVIPDTAQAYITINGDLLGQTIENLDDLISLPTGCGEQIMASLAPNLYILRYLSAVNNLTPLVRQKAMRNIKIGYQAILNYIHKDGSFSAFGYHDPMGSMFLTTFVVRTLQDAKSYIYVDQRIIDRAVAWIFDHQLENGCFNTMLHVFQDMGGTSSENSTAALTAYVIISLMEAGIEVPEKVTTNAKYCIRGQYNPDKYTLAISSYALYIVEWYVEADRLLKRLVEVASTEKNKMWWTNKDSDNSLATDIEVTSYVLLSLLRRNTTENLAHAHSVIRWLTSKRSPHGGFKSTQDTVVGLDAITKYAVLLTSKKLDVDVTIETANKYHVMRINRDIRLKSKTVYLEDPDTEVKVSLAGEGCVLAQYVLSYYVNRVPVTQSFKLSMDIESVSNIDECSIAMLSPCLAYKGPDKQANMAVLEITLPSGYEPDRASLYKLVDEETGSRVKKFEENNNQVVFYFTQLNKEQVCINFNIQENVMVDSRTNSIIKLYDYYKPELEVSQFYKMKEKCRFNDTVSIPEISAKAFDGIEETDNEKDVSKDIMHDIIDYPLSDMDTEEQKDLDETSTIPSMLSDLYSFSFPNSEDEEDEFYRRRKRDVMNPDFVDMDVDMDTPDCGLGMQSSVEMNSTRNQNTSKGKPVTKRDLQQTGLNPDFVNMDIEMEMPNGMEANMPVYMKSNKTEMRRG